jgi:hypothetical protein
LNGAAPIATDNQAMKSVLAALAAATVGLAGCGTAETYNADEVRVAFAKAGYTLHEPSTPASVAAAEQFGTRVPTILLPIGGEPFTVFVGTITDAEEVWFRYQSQQGDGTFDARRANVIVISDSGLTSAQRAQVRAALEALPDRGGPVQIASR